MFEFDPSIDGPTPEHVRWTLVHECPLRAGTDVRNPDQTERLLRALQYISFARESDTVVRSLVVHNFWNSQIWAFDVNQAEQPFGGANQIEQCCRDCPANAKGESSSNAHCFGTVSLPVDPAKRERLLKLVDSPPDNELSRRLSKRVVAKRWHQMWANFQETQTEDALNELLIIACQIAQYSEAISGFEKGSWTHFIWALLQAKDRPELRLSLSLHPAGVTYNRKWQVDPHCIRCKATWQNERRQSCEMCGHQGGRQPSRTRKRIGTRPFRPIEDFVPADQIPAIMDEWSARLAKASPLKTSLLVEYLSAFGSLFGFWRGG